MGSFKEIEEIKKQGVDVTPDNFMISEPHPLYCPFIKRWMRSERMLQVKIRLELHEEVLDLVTRTKSEEDQLENNWRAQTVT